MIFNRDVNGSMSEWLKEADCKSARLAYAGSNPARPTIYRLERDKSLSFFVVDCQTASPNYLLLQLQGMNTPKKLKQLCGHVDKIEFLSDFTPKIYAKIRLLPLLSLELSALILFLKR